MNMFRQDSPLGLLLRLPDGSEGRVAWDNGIYADVWTADGPRRLPVAELVRCASVLPAGSDPVTVLRSGLPEEWPTRASAMRYYRSQAEGSEGLLRDECARVVSDLARGLGVASDGRVPAAVTS